MINWKSSISLSLVSLAHSDTSVIYLSGIIMLPSAVRLVHIQRLLGIYPRKGALLPTIYQWSSLDYVILLGLVLIERDCAFVAPQPGPLICSLLQITVRRRLDFWRLIWADEEASSPWFWVLYKVVHFLQFCRLRNVLSEVAAMEYAARMLSLSVKPIPVEVCWWCLFDLSGRALRCWLNN